MATTTRTKVTFTNSDYTRTHGKAPKGYGGWFFAVVVLVVEVATGQQHWENGWQLFQATGTLADARKTARAKVLAALATDLLEGFRMLEVVLDTQG